MINKVYEQIKKYIKQNIIFFIILIIVLLLSIIELPYYINAPGGLVNLNKKIIIENEYEGKGSFNMAYVSEYKSNVLMLLYSLLNPHFDIYKKDEYMLPNDEYKNMIYREKLQMEEAINNATILAYQKSLNDINITKVKIYVSYILEGSITSLEVGDEILSIDNEKINSKEELFSKISSYEVGESFNLEVINNGKQYTRYAKTRMIENKKAIGINLVTNYEYEETPKIKFKYKKNEYGPSGGLMMSLEIYNELVSDDLTRGYKIAGTGTIDINGNVGSIGGVKYKLRGAVKRKADIFLVPLGENYEDAIKEVKKNNYNIKIIGVKTFDEAINYLTSLEKR